jgi:hypothetical protein
VQYGDNVMPSFWAQWDGLGDSDDNRPVGKRELPPFERKPHPSPACAHKMRKKWSEIEEKNLVGRGGEVSRYSCFPRTLTVLAFCSNSSKAP